MHLDATSRAGRDWHDITKGIAVRFWLQLGRRLGVLEPLFLSVDFRPRGGLSFGVLMRPLSVLVTRPFLACVPPFRVAAACDAAACDAEITVGASGATAAVNASDAAASDAAAAAAADASDAPDASEAAARAASAASHAATTVNAAFAASAATHAPAAARLYLDERALLDSPAPEHRLTLEPLAAVVKLEGVSR